MITTPNGWLPWYLRAIKMRSLDLSQEHVSDDGERYDISQALETP